MLDILRLAVDFGLVVLIWLVQLVIYPSFRYYDAKRLRQWHEVYTQRVSLVVVPLMFAQAALFAQVWMQGAALEHLVAGVAILLAWGMTFLHAVPCHQRIATDAEPAVAIDRLVRGNWVRTAAWSAAFLLDLAGTLRRIH